MYQVQGVLYVRESLLPTLSRMFDIHGPVINGPKMDRESEELMLPTTNPETAG